MKEFQLIGKDKATEVELEKACWLYLEGDEESHDWGNQQFTRDVSFNIFNGWWDFEMVGLYDHPLTTRDLHIYWDANLDSLEPIDVGTVHYQYDGATRIAWPGNKSEILVGGFAKVLCMAQFFGATELVSTAAKEKRNKRSFPLPMQRALKHSWMRLSSDSHWIWIAHMRSYVKDRFDAQLSLSRDERRVKRQEDLSDYYVRERVFNPLNLEKYHRVKNGEVATPATKDNVEVLTTSGDEPINAMEVLEVGIIYPIANREGRLMTKVPPITFAKTNECVDALEAVAENRFRLVVSE